MRNRRGSILVIVLFVSSVLNILALSLTYRACLELRAVRHRVALAQVRAHAASAAAIAMRRLSADPNALGNLAEPWHAHGPLWQEFWLPEWAGEPGGQGPPVLVDYQTADEEGKLNVLFASGDVLARLGMSSEQIDCLMDYMDEDDFARAGGAEEPYYLGLWPPRHCKNAPLQLIDELESVKGFGPLPCRGTPLALGGPEARSADEAAAGGDPNLVGWAELLTCVGDGRVNLNTAPEPVLRTLPISGDALQRVLSIRTCSGGDDLAAHTFRSPTDVEQLQGLTDHDRQVLESMGGYRSRHFTIRVRARHVLTGITCELSILVRRGEGKLDILKWRIGT
jgi:type II secretory pathway component PulK